MNTKQYLSGYRDGLRDSMEDTQKIWKLELAHTQKGANAALSGFEMDIYVLTAHKDEARRLAYRFIMLLEKYENYSAIIDFIREADDMSFTEGQKEKIRILTSHIKAGRYEDVTKEIVKDMELSRDW